MRRLSEETLNQAAKNYITLPVQLPIFHSRPNLENFAAWAEGQDTPMARNIAHKIINHMQYIDFENFLSTLQQTINSFHLQSSQQPYVLLLAEYPGKLSEGCSDTWVAGLALEYCGLKEPAAILNAFTFGPYMTQHPEFTQVLIIDDAAYSGTQKTESLLNLFRRNQKLAARLDIYLAIPYMTTNAEQKIGKTQPFFDAVTIVDHQLMPVITGILNPEELYYAQRIGMGYISSGHTITWFDHRFADFFSCIQNIYHGDGLLNHKVADMMHFAGYSPDADTVRKNRYLTLMQDDTEEYNRIASTIICPNYTRNEDGYTIPIIIPPYRLTSAQSLRAMQKALKNNRLGERTCYPIHDLQVADLIGSTPSGENKFTPYQRSRLPVEIQEAFDNAVVLGNHEYITWIELATVHQQHQELLRELLQTPPELKATHFDRAYPQRKTNPSALYFTILLLLVIYLLCQTNVYRNPDRTKEDANRNEELANTGDSANKFAMA